MYSLIFQDDLKENVDPNKNKGRIVLKRKLFFDEQFPIIKKKLYENEVKIYN